MMLSHKSRRRKGHDWEREVAKRIRKIDPSAKRLLEYQEGKGIDIDTKLPFAIQCKCQKRVNFLKALEEAGEMAEELDKFPIVVAKVMRKGEFVFMEWETFDFLLRRLKNGGF